MTFSLGFLFCFEVSGQFKDTIWVPVRFYDFHSDRSNPEFEVRHQGGLRSGMVANTLDEEKKPQPGPDPYLNHYVKYWFRPWSDSAQGDFNRPNYDPSAGYREYINGWNEEGNVNVTYLGDTLVDHDTSFINMVIDTHLVFRHLSDGVYYFDDQEFFPLDGKGFGNEWTNASAPNNASHNFSFTMEMVWRFKMEDGLRFEFRGDDDVWVFIDNQLVMDLGGIHGPEEGSVDLRSLNLTNGQSYDFRLFYAERHTTGSSIRITTNIIFSPPDSLRIDVSPSDTIQAGDTLFAKAKIFADTGEVKDFPGTFTWSYEDLEGVNPPSTFKWDQSSPDALFIPTEAYTHVIIRGEYYDPETGRTVKDSVIIYVEPGDPDTVVIEASADSLRSLRDVDALEEVRIGMNQTTNDDFFAILRDKYGNWVGPAGPSLGSAVWGTEHQSIATATNGQLVTKGQGKATRVTDEGGETKITVEAQSHNRTFNDDVRLIIEDVTYDSLVLGVKINGVFTEIDSIRMRTSRDTTLWVQQRRSGTDTWEELPARFTQDGLTLQTDPPNSNLVSWRFTPTQVATGSITASAPGELSGTQISDRVVVIVEFGDPDKMRFYPRAGDPVNMVEYPSRDTVTAGVDYGIFAKLFDKSDTWLSDYETVDSLRNRITWSIQPDNARRTTLSHSIGNRTTFNSTLADNEFVVTATYAHDTVISRSITLYVEHGPPAMLVLEPNDRGRTDSPNDPYRFAENTMTITSLEAQKRAYAVIRDEHGNYIRPSGAVDHKNPTLPQSTEWTVLEPPTPTIIHIQKGLGIKGEGIVHRDSAEGVCRITAKDVVSGLDDTLTVRLLKYFYDKLQIVVNPGEVEIDELAINTNQDTTLYVLGRRSDDSTIWEPVSSAIWERSEGLIKALPNTVINRGSWFISPVDTGSGWIRVTLGNDEQTEPDTIQVVFTPGPAHRAEIDIITRNPVAGDTIEAVVRIYNKDGLVPGRTFYDLNAFYKDTLGNGGPLCPEPRLITDSSGVILSDGVLSYASGVKQLFMGGIDTIRIVLFHAPEDSMHQISTVLDTIHAVSEPFKLNPASLDSIILVDHNGVPVGDTITLRHDLDEKITITSVGYDRFGNRIGPVPSHWTKDGDLHDLRVEDGPSIVYEARDADDNSQGNITAEAHDDPNPWAKVYIKIVGVMTRIRTAITRDLDGDGFLDHIEVRLNKPASVTGFDPDIRRGVYVFEHDSIWTESGEAEDDVIMVRLKEITNSGPQTSWKPNFSSETFGEVAQANFECEDGAGPVIWTAVKYFDQKDENGPSRIVITLSEKILKADGTNFQVDNLPNTVFNIFNLVETDTTDEDSFDTLHNYLSAVESFIDVDDSVLVFVTTSDLGTNHFVNLQTLPHAVIDRQAHNAPDPNNRKVRFTLGNEPPQKAVPFPNPGSGDPTLVKPGKFEPWHNPNAITHIKDRGGNGLVIQFSTYIPHRDSGVVKAQMKIYDLAGNLVHSESSNNLIRDSRLNAESGSHTQINVYWNGYNSKGMKVAPGIYRMVIFLDFTSSVYKDRKHQVTLGVAK